MSPGERTKDRGDLGKKRRKSRGGKVLGAIFRVYVFSTPSHQTIGSYTYFPAPEYLAPNNPRCVSSTASTSKRMPGEKQRMDNTWECLHSSFGE